MISVQNCLNAMYRISCFDGLYISYIHIISSNCYHLSRPIYSICDSVFYFSYNYPYWYKMLCLFMLTHSFYHMQFESCLQNSAVLFLVMWWNVNKSFKLIDTSIIYINNGKIIHFIKLSNMGPNDNIGDYQLQFWD